MIKPLRQHRLEIRAQAAYDFIAGVIKTVVFFAFVILWCGVPYVS